MSLVYSKPVQHDLTFETDQPSTSFEPNDQACDQLDANLIDNNIKFVIVQS